MADRPSTSSGRTAKYLNFHLRNPFVLRLSKHERIFSQPLRMFDFIREVDLAACSLIYIALNDGPGAIVKAITVLT